jgi:hypothetical protein
MLDSLHAGWVSRGKKKPTPEIATAIASRIKNAYAELRRAEASVVAAQTEIYSACGVLAMNYGRRTFDFQGLGTCTLGCRGSLVFLKFSSGKEKINFE